MRISTVIAAAHHLVEARERASVHIRGGQHHMAQGGSSVAAAIGRRQGFATPSQSRFPLPAGEGQGEGGMLCPCGGDWLLTDIRGYRPSSLPALVLPLNQTTEDWHTGCVTLSGAKGLVFGEMLRLRLSMTAGRGRARCTNVVWFDLGLRMAPFDGLAFGSAESPVRMLRT